MLQPPFAEGRFDLVWSVNVINHLHDPAAGVRTLSRLLRPGGRIAVGQSSLVPDMYFAWDARLETCVNEAVRAYYRECYRSSERDFRRGARACRLVASGGLARRDCEHG